MGLRNALLVAGLPPWRPGWGQAALFSDDEARKAIIDLRQRVEAQKATAEAIEKRLTDENNQLRRSLLDLQNQIETLRAEQARMRGQGEQMSREIAETQRRQTTQTQSLDERLRSMEPQKVTVGWPGIRRDVRRRCGISMPQWGYFEAVTSRRRRPRSWILPSASPRAAITRLLCSGWATRNMRRATTKRPSPIFDRHVDAGARSRARAPEAILSIANCQIELKDNKAARRTLEDLIRLHPQSEAAQAAKERLAKLR
jgi:TolA-binding protein